MNSSHLPIMHRQVKEEDVINLNDILSVLWSYRLFIVSFTVVMAIVTVLILMFLKPSYQATAVLQIKKDQATQVELLKSRELIVSVAKNLELENSSSASLKENMSFWASQPEISAKSDRNSESQNELAFTSLLSDLQKGLNVEWVNSTSIVKVHFTSHSPELSMEIANNLVDQYIKNYQESNKVDVARALDRLQVSLADLGESMGRIVGQAGYEALASRGGLEEYLQEMSELTEPKIVDRAAYPLDPVKTKKVLIFILVSVLSAIFVIVLVLLRTALDRTIHSAKELEELVGIPVLGVLPVFKKNTTEVNFNEAVRNLCARLRLQDRNQSNKAYAITSSTDGEGSSTLASSLAEVLALRGKVVLVDADFRKKHDSSVVSSKKGVASILTGEFDFQSLLEEVSGYHYISAGQLQQHPQEVLASDEFAELLSILRKKYEYVIIDTPSLQLGGDALLIGEYVDGIIYNIGAGRVDREQVVKEFQYLQRSDLSVRAIVMNRAQII